MKHFMIGAYDIIRSGFYRYEMEYKTIDEFIFKGDKTKCDKLSYSA